MNPTRLARAVIQYCHQSSREWEARAQEPDCRYPGPARRSALMYRAIARRVARGTSANCKALLYRRRYRCVTVWAERAGLL